MQQKPSALIKPTLDTTYHIDYGWWERPGEDLHTYLLSHLPPEQRSRISASSEAQVVDFVDPETAEVSKLTELDLAIQLAARDPDFINPQTSVVDSIFRVFLANHNTPMTPKELGDAIGRSPTVILKTISGGRVYKGIRPVEILTEHKPMGRVINTDSTGKNRNQQLRTGAEILRRLTQKTEIDDEVKDMVSALVYALREIADGIDSSAAAWEKRDYWMKADELRMRWDWTAGMADQLAALVYEDRWGDLPQMMVKLFPRFNDIKITKMTRKEDAWQGAHMRLLREQQPKLK